MFRIGCHLSMSKGYLAMGKEALSLGANTFQYFSRNPRGSGVKPFDTADADAFIAFAAEHDIRKVLTHAPYILNSCAATEELRKASLEIMTEDVRRLEYFPEAMYNFHPGAHVGQGTEAGIGFIADLLNRLIVPGQKTVVLLETMSGKGTEVGRDFEELASILERVTADREKHVGICMDTCHISDAGYDVKDRLDEVLETFDRVIGLSRLYAVHLNDSKNPLGAHKDRHEKIGEGFLGTGTFSKIINHAALRDLPFYLETPQDLQGYAQEIRLLSSLYQPDEASGER
ncbi:MAG: deoxyribonuclease IV [Lachnospiraceae bacterium]|nr:deoxyribonuclease IV [Lachnospiraceae bacterium]